SRANARSAGKLLPRRYCHLGRRNRSIVASPYCSTHSRMQAQTGLICDLVLKRTDPFHGDFDRVTGIEWSNSARGSCSDQVAWQQSHHLRNVASDKIERKNEIACIALLSQLSVHPSFNDHA